MQAFRDVSRHASVGKAMDGSIVISKMGGLSHGEGVSSTDAIANQTIAVFEGSGAALQLTRWACELGLLLWMLGLLIL